MKMNIKGLNAILITCLFLVLSQSANARLAKRFFVQYDANDARLIYHDGEYYNYAVNGKFYNYKDNGKYYRYFTDGGFYNYYYTGEYYKNCMRTEGYWLSGVWVGPVTMCG